MDQDIRSPITIEIAGGKPEWIDSVRCVHSPPETGSPRGRAAPATRVCRRGPTGDGRPAAGLVIRPLGQNRADHVADAVAIQVAGGLKIAECAPRFGCERAKARTLPSTAPQRSARPSPSRSAVWGDESRSIRVLAACRRGEQVNDRWIGSKVRIPGELPGAGRRRLVERASASRPARGPTRTANQRRHVFVIENGAPVPELLPILARNGIDVDPARLPRLPDEGFVGDSAGISRNDHEVAGAVGVKIGRGQQVNQAVVRVLHAGLERAVPSWLAGHAIEHANAAVRTALPAEAVDVRNHDIGAAIAVEVSRQGPIPHAPPWAWACNRTSAYWSRCVAVAVENAVIVGFVRGSTTLTGLE